MWTKIRLKRLRKRTKLTQAGLAQRLNVSVDTVRSWERERNQPSGPASVLLALMELYGDLHPPRPAG